VPARYSAADYRERLYREIARRKSEVREARASVKGGPAAVAGAGAGAGTPA